MTTEKSRAIIEDGVRLYGSLPGFFACQANWGINGGSRSYLMLEPVAKVTGYLERSQIVDSKDRVMSFNNCFGALEAICSLKEGNIPFSACCLNYELLHAIESLPDRKISRDTELYQAFLYRRVRELGGDGVVSEHLLEYADFSIPFWHAKNIFKSETNQSEKTTVDFRPRSSLEREQYLSAVERVRTLIKDGEVYQVNLTQMFSGDICDNAKLPATIWQNLLERTQADYAAYACLSTNRYILSASPELFIRAHAGSLYSSPIKGTCVRSQERAEDAERSKQLLASEKNLAELAMIVDLIRNDMGRIATPGSVRVFSYPRLYSLPYVHHLVGDVTCNLSPGAELITILKALFPCGSITGAPKLAAMRYIAELEPSSRGIYTGAVGIIAGPRDFQFNVAIRTIEVSSGQVRYGAGGGIVYDSEPQSEFEECIAKATPILCSIEQALFRN